MVTFILAAMVGAQEPTTLASKITSASIYRSGLTLVTREVTVPAGKGTYKLDAVPSALDGGFWFGSPDDVKVQDVRTKLKSEEKTVDFAPQTIFDIMAANIGKKIRIGLPETVVRGNTYAQEAKWITGTVVRMGSPPNGVALFKLEDGSLRFLSPSSVIDIDPTGLELVWKRKVTEYSVQASFSVDTPKPSRVRFTTLERGPMWLPSFMIDFDSRTSATLFAKVQLGLPGWTFDNTDVQLLAGKPALSDATGMADLASGQTTLEGFAAGQSAKLFPGNSDPFESVVRSELMSYSGYFSGSGGFGGGGFGQGGGGFGGMNNNVPNNYSDTRGADKILSEPEVNRSFGIYKIPMGKLTMEPGERLTRNLFSSKGTVRRYVELAFTQSLSPTIRDRISIKNESGLTWIPGKCTILEGGAPIAVTGMPFCPPNQECSIFLGETDDVKVDSTSEGGPMERATLKSGFKGSVPTTLNDITMENLRDEPVEIDFRFSYDSYDLECSEGKVVKIFLSETLRKCNLTHKFTLKPGEVKKMRIILKAFIPDRS
ncbi:MAG: hypothetical protein ABL949_02615 [Fimbriimonadaceae bacterium]